MSDLVLVPHSHWDREWYEPFQRFRFRLVDMFDEVLDRLEADGEFRFTLDGQTAAIEDYLEIRPQHRDRVTERVRAGQLAIGPFHILLDEFLCAGETIVRNLQLGIAGADALGGAMPVGYLPDMFGHIAQMPQLLRQAGIADAVLWRGVPAVVTGHAFRWVAPSGDEVRVEYLFDSYGNGLGLTTPPGRLGELGAEYQARTAGRFAGDPALGMVGGDHTSPDPHLMDAVRQARTDGLAVEVATLAQYVPGRSRHGHVVRGELRSHAVGNVLPGVISVRRSLKVAMAAAEGAVLSAERLMARWSSVDHGPFLRLAWRKIVESSAHDSVVGSGVDATVRQVHTRLEEAEQLGRAVADAVLGAVASDVPADGFVVVNTLAQPVEALVDVVLDADGGELPTVVDGAGRVRRTQVVGGELGDLGDEKLDAGQLLRLLQRIHGRELYGQLIERVEFGDHELTLFVARTPATESFDGAAFRRRLAQEAADQPGPWRIRTVARRRLRALVEVPVGPMGRISLRPHPPAPVAEPPTRGDVVVVSGGVDRGDGVVLANGSVTVQVGSDGLVAITGPRGERLEGVGRIVDGGDRGDAYNFGPPADDEVIDRPTAVEVVVEHAGPLLGSVAVYRWYQWPVGLGDSADKRSGATAPVEVVTRYQLRAGEPLVRVTVDFVNQMRNHRTRLHIPLPERVGGSASMGQFAVTERGLTAEGGGGEYPLPTFPAYEFVSAGGLTVLVGHATEYEVVDGGGELALTLLRAVGMISVNVHPLRDEPAAAEIAIPGGQEIGTPLHASFALLVDRRGWRAADAVGWQARWVAPPVVAAGRAARHADLPVAQSGLSVGGDSIALSAWRRQSTEVDELRLVNYSPELGTATITADYASIETTDLLDRRLGLPAPRRADGGGWQVDLPPWAVVTLAAHRSVR